MNSNIFSSWRSEKSRTTVEKIRFSSFILFSLPPAAPGERPLAHDRVQEVLRRAVRLPEPLATTAGGDGGNSGVQDTPLPPSPVRLPDRIRAPALTRTHRRRAHAEGKDGDLPVYEQRRYPTRCPLGV